jgi:predicted RNase H-like HicB family nuclease
MTKYRVKLERDASGAWIAKCLDVPGCHTYGRSLRQARSRVREALALWVDDADKAELVFQYHFPSEWREAVEACRRSRTRALNAERDAQAITAAIATELTQSQGLSLRDVAEMFGLSHQRVQQIVQSATRTSELSVPSRDRVDKLKAALRESSRGSSS